jgi:hypothetical protein
MLAQPINYDVRCCARGVTTRFSGAAMNYLNAQLAQAFSARRFVDVHAWGFINGESASAKAKARF